MGDKNDVVLFNNSSLSKCQEILKVRRDQNLKYSTVELPEVPDNIHGYHMPCYRRFTALSKCQRDIMQRAVKIDINNSNPIEEPTDQSGFSLMTKRSEIKSPKPSRIGTFPSLCLFCNQSRKKVKGIEQKLVNVETNDFEKQVRKYIEWMEDSKPLARVTGVNFSAKDVKYHECCRVKYQTEAEGKVNQKRRLVGKDIPTKESTSAWHKSREIHKKSFEALVSCLEEIVFEKKEVLLLTDINIFNHHLLTEFRGEEFDTVGSTAQKLEEKLLKHYGDKICIISGNTFTKDNMVFTASLSVNEAVKKLDVKGNDLKVKIRDVALILLEEINKSEKKQLPENLKIEDIQKSEVDIPELLKLSFQNIIGGPDSRRWASNLKQIRTKSISEDVAFAATSGLIKPQKHLMLGFALRSLTGSRQIVEIMNRLGHCISYHTIEEIETEATFV